MSAGITPSAVSTPVTLPPSWAMPVTVVEPRKVTPRSLERSISNCTARAARASPSVGMSRPPRTSRPPVSLPVFNSG